MIDAISSQMLLPPIVSVLQLHVVSHLQCWVQVHGISSNSHITCTWYLTKELIRINHNISLTLQ